MSELLDGLRRIVAPDRVRDDDEIHLDEKNPNSICKPVRLDYRGSRWALRVESNDHLKLLVGSTDEAKLTGWNRLPDWLVFCEPTKRGRRSHDLWAIVCELKSGGKRDASAVRQVQLGKFLVEYLVGLATFALGRVKDRPWRDRVDIRGLLVSPRAPTIKWGTGTDDPHDDYQLDQPSQMAIHRASDDDAIRVEDLFE